MRLIAPIMLCCTLGCADFPELDGIVAPADASAPYPRLTPLDPLLAQATQATTARITPATLARTDSRIAALQARAQTLRGPIIPAATRAAMRAAARRAALR